MENYTGLCHIFLLCTEQNGRDRGKSQRENIWNKPLWFSGEHLMLCLISLMLNSLMKKKNSYSVHGSYCTWYIIHRFYISSSFKIKKIIRGSDLTGSTSVMLSYYPSSCLSICFLRSSWRADIKVIYYENGGKKVYAVRSKILKNTCTLLKFWLGYLLVN
jgi:hypothetical protein